MHEKIIETREEMAKKRKEREEKEGENTGGGPYIETPS